MVSYSLCIPPNVLSPVACSLLQGKNQSVYAGLEKNVDCDAMVGGAFVSFQAMWLKLVNTQSSFSVQQDIRRTSHDALLTKDTPTHPSHVHTCTNRIKHTRTWSLPRCSCSSFHGNVQNNEVRSCGGQSECAQRTLSYPLASRVCARVCFCVWVHVDVPWRFQNRERERENYEGDTRSPLWERAWSTRSLFIARQMEGERLVEWKTGNVE